MTAIIQESQILAEIIPEIHYYMDTDTPMSDEILATVERYVSKLVLRAFHHLVEEGSYIALEPEWMNRLRKDPALLELSILTWVEVQVLDTDGTFIIFTKEKIRC